MKIHLPLSIRRCLLACITSTAGVCICGTSAMAESQNLTFSGSDLTWNTLAENAAFVTGDGASAPFTQGDNVSFTNKATVTLEENISAGTIKIESEADVIILQDNYTLEAERIELAGTLDAGGPLHIDNGTTLAVVSAPAVLNSNLVLGNGGTLASGAAANLNGNTLALYGGSELQLTATGDGKTYTLFTGISGLKDAQGNTIALDSTNNAITNYFDTTQPGTGFWADATLQLSADGILRLVRHSEAVKAAVTISTRRTGSAVDYQYYLRVHFADIEYTASSYYAYGGAIYGMYSSSTITLSDNGSVTFSRNTASSSNDDAYGGAICGDDGSTITLSDNGSVTFSGNTAESASFYAYGGAIYGDWDSTITLSNNGSVTFSGNTASASSSASGGAIDGRSYSTITLSNNGSVVFEGNTASSSDSSAYGGAIVGYRNSTITLSDNGSVTFSGNTASASSSAEGGAIYGDDRSTITLSNNGSVVFEGNTASSSSSPAYGGAIYRQLSPITLSNNGSVTFSGNTASASSSACGGAIYGYGSTITLSKNGSVTFSGNTASASSSACGGAINGRTITLNNNGSVAFSGNTASGSSTTTSSAYGGAIYGDDGSTITLSNNGSVTFSGNTASGSSYAYGGAIYGYGSTITLSDNGSVTFSGNTASGSSTTTSSAYGGAIYGDSSSTITLSGNGSVVFEGNTASSSSSPALGGAIFGSSSSTITLSDNGSVTFSGNTAESASSNACGGAIYGNSIMLSNNGSVSFSGNTASASSNARGGAIYTQGDLSIRNNDSVEFYQNAEVVNGNTYRLRSIYAGGSGAEISLSAAAGKSITFRDSIYIDSGSSFKLNETYEGKAQLGDIIFTGATTVDDLYTVKGNVAGSTEEIRLSRTTEVNTLTNLYGGRLRVEEGAIYQGWGITAMEGSAATVRVQNATLSHEGYDLTFNAGTTLELTGANTITGNVQMLEGSWLAFDGTESKGMSWLTGNLSFTGGANVSLSGNADWSGQNEILMYVDGSVSGWDENTLSIRNGAGSTADLRLVNGDLLVLNYNAETFKPYFKGDITVTTRQTSANYRYYDSVLFEKIKADGSHTYGGAIHGNSIMLSNNGSVTISGNTASGSSYAYGGAIYGDSSSTITLSDNGSVTISGNTASGSSSTYSSASGGAIYGGSGSFITLSNNKGSITFSGNTAESASSYSSASGGAIYGGSGSFITLSDNGSVVFEGNTASSSDYSAYGGAIFGYDSSISLSNNESVTFSGNAVSASSYAEGGAISGGTITLSDNGSVTFSGNTASSSDDYARGGAIYGSWDSTIMLSNNGSVTISGNTASASSDACGGAIYGGSGSFITLSDNGSVVFEGNTASASSRALGGAIYGDQGSTITLSSNGSVTFSGNTAKSTSDSGYNDASGGAIYGGSDSFITLSNNKGSITFSGNTSESVSSSASGGAIYGDYSSTITLSDNGSVSFSGNTASSTYAYGGAIFGGGDGIITLSDNGSVVFEGNTASGSTRALGGAIFGSSSSTITLSDNGSVTFSGNTAESASSNACGGAILGDTITLSNNGSVTFSGNTASSSDSYASGGAIYASGNLSIRNNDSVEFYQNAEVENGTYRLRSIYAGGSGDAISLSAAAGKRIEFRDSVYIASGSTVNLNADYTYLDEAGESVTIRQTGDIIFTGKYTETHLNEILKAGNAGRNASKVEILNSRTSEVYTMTNLYGGRLRVEDGAVYKGNGITAHVDSAATVRVKDAELSHVGYELKFNAGTALEVAGNSTIRGNVKLLEKSTFKLEQAATLSLHETVEADVAALTVNGTALLKGNSTLNASLTLADGATLDMDVLDAGAVTLNGALTFAGKVCMGTQLQDILSEMRGWEESITLFTGLTNLVLPGTVSEDATGRVWVGDVFSNMEGHTQYYFNYSPDVGSLAVVYIPEPATSTLSLLALTALATRRKRK